MVRGIRRWWNYMGAWVGGKASEHADPRIQIEQAIDESKRQHQLLTQQAAAVLGNQRQLEIQLGRQIDEVAKLKASAGQALRLADKAQTSGDEKAAGEYEQTAQAFASQLVSKEQSVQEMKALHDKALQAAQVARKAVEQNAYQLQQKLAERSKLLTQLESARMQERMNQALQSVSALQPAGDTPTLDEVRNKIEGRYAKAMGVADLQNSGIEARMLEVDRATLDGQATLRLDEIRRDLNLTGGTTARVVEDTPKAIGGEERAGLPPGEAAPAAETAPAAEAVPLEKKPTTDPAS